MFWRSDRRAPGDIEHARLLTSMCQVFDHQGAWQDLNIDPEPFQSAEKLLTYG